MKLESKNLVTLLTTNIHSELVPFTYKTIINVLTGLVGSSLLRHSYERSRGEVAEPTLDERNEQDEAARGQASTDVINENFGVAWTPMSSFRTAALADGMRHYIYEELCAYGEFKENALLHTPPVKITDRINYDQPMSLEMYLEFRVKMADSIDEAKIPFLAIHLEEPEEVIRHALKAEAAKLKASLIRAVPEVMMEAEGFTEVFEPELFNIFDISVQMNCAEKISEKFNKEYQRVLAKACRGDLAAASDLAMLKIQFKVIKDWMAANDAEFRVAKAWLESQKAA